jgi:TPP-dependent pyruvate/acetoin dehydrogenase alpha subunit
MSEAQAAHTAGAADEAARRSDPLPIYRAKLLEAGALTEAVAVAIEKDAGREADEAIAYGRASERADPAMAFRHVFA